MVDTTTGSNHNKMTKNFDQTRRSLYKQLINLDRDAESDFALTSLKRNIGKAQFVDIRTNKILTIEIRKGWNKCNLSVISENEESAKRFLNHLGKTMHGDRHTFDYVIIGLTILVIAGAVTLMILKG
jgi:hypothetical protein